MNTRLTRLVTRLRIIKMFPDISEKILSIKEGFHVVHFDIFSALNVKNLLPEGC